jgi:hypothetical protein
MIDMKTAHLGTNMKIIDLKSNDWDFWCGRLLIYKAPEPGKVYWLGVDPAEGVRGDRSVCQVGMFGDMQHPDEQVAEFACDFLDPVDFASIVDSIGRLYADPDGTEAFLTLEINAPCGDTMCSDLRYRLDYGNLFIRKSYDKINNMYTNTYGWSTNKSTRPKIIARGVHALQYGDLIINSPFLIDEMSDFKRDRFDEKPEARKSSHDDRVMALLLGYYGAHDEEWLAGEDLAEQRRSQLKQRAIEQELQSVGAHVAPEIIPPARRGVDYQSRAISFNKMQSEAEESLFDD